MIDIVMRDIVKRVAEGLSTVEDAQVLEKRLARLDAYEDALKKIAVHGTPADASIAIEVLTCAIDDRH